jgi:hypothetical protein
MPGAYRRKTDRARGGAGKYTCWWIGPDGRKRQRAGFTDKGKSLDLARALDYEARLVREGLVDPGRLAARAAAARPVADHVADYRADLLARGVTPRHARHVACAVTRTLADAGVGSLADLAADRLRGALGRLRARRSPRTANHALASIKAFGRWLALNNRIGEVPRGLRNTHGGMQKKTPNPGATETRQGIRDL